jgi:hypothetical protein
MMLYLQEIFRKKRLLRSQGLPSLDWLNLLRQEKLLWCLLDMRFLEPFKPLRL